MDTKFLNVIVLAENYEDLIKWYIKTFGLKKTATISDGYHYTELSFKKNPIFGIVKAEDMDFNPSSPRNNSVIVQLRVSDINFLFANTEAYGGKILFGPTRDEINNYTYGGIADIEGNEIWVIEEKLEKDELIDKLKLR